MPFTFLALATALAVQPARPAGTVGPKGTLRLVAERPADVKRHCIPGPHEIGRTRKMPAVAATSAAPWFYLPSQDYYPHCRYDSQEEADRAAREGD